MAQKKKKKEKVNQPTSVILRMFNKIWQVAATIQENVFRLLTATEKKAFFAWRGKGEQKTLRGRVQKTDVFLGGRGL